MKIEEGSQIRALKESPSGAQRILGDAGAGAEV